MLVDAGMWWGMRFVMATAALVIGLAPRVAAYDEIALPIWKAIPSGNVIVENVGSVPVDVRTFDYIAGHALAGSVTDCLTWQFTAPSNFGTDPEVDGVVYFTDVGRCAAGDAFKDCFINGDCPITNTCVYAGTSGAITQPATLRMGCVGNGQSYAGLDILGNTSGSPVEFAIGTAAAQSFALFNVKEQRADGGIDASNCASNEEAAVQLCLPTTVNRNLHILGVGIRYPCTGSGGCP